MPRAILTHAAHADRSQVRSVEAETPSSSATEDTVRERSACATCVRIARGMAPPLCAPAYAYRFLSVRPGDATGTGASHLSKLFKKLFIVHSVRSPQFFYIFTAQDAAP